MRSSFNNLLTHIKLKIDQIYIIIEKKIFRENENLENYNTLSVFISRREKCHCLKCNCLLKKDDYVVAESEKGRGLCLKCSPFRNLSFLPSGDAALTRRSKKHSKISVILQQWNNRRKRYERKGIYAEESAIKKANIECLQDKEQRAKIRKKAAIKRKEQDIEYIKLFSKEIRLLFPSMPKGREVLIAEHACEKYSGRVGRTAAAKELDEDMITRAVIAHIRHNETEYDDLFGKGKRKREIRNDIKPFIESILSRWKRSIH